MKLSQRLKTIDSFVTRKYDHIWDCCCDHGLLGQALLKRNAATTVHFVDVVESLMVNVQSQLERFFPENNVGASWKVHCLNVAALPIASADTVTATHLIIIAGVGGELVIELVKAIKEANPNHHMEFLLCPVHHNYKVRQALIRMGFGLIDEALLLENKRFYEVMHVSQQANGVLVNVGSKMWDLSRTVDQAYLASIISHYRRMSNNPDQDVSHALSDYLALNR